MPTELNFKPVPPKRRGGLWRTLRFLLSGPVAAFGAKNIAEGAHTINKLTDTIKAGPQPDRRVRTDEDSVLDLAAIAFLSGSSEAEVERQLANRRRQTAWATRCYLAGGCGFLLLWFWQALLSPAYASFSYVLGLLALCAAFFLSAFHNALVNWQARTRRLGTAREFLHTRETWWPS